ncbi:MAG: hypothetical protein WBD74_15790 [Candidatus Aquilonibacter sp.]
MTTFVLQTSDYVPLAIGFFGLATGYFIWGGQEFFGWPADSPDVDKSMGMWGVWMPGFMQLVAGTYIFVGLTWFQVFKGAPLYMAGLAFTAYGVHWFVIGSRRFFQADARPEAWMAIAFFLISLLGLLIFSGAGDVPVALIFLGLVLVYIAEILKNFNVVPNPKLLGFCHCITGIWLMYCCFAATFNSALGAHWWI